MGHPIPNIQYNGLSVENDMLFKEPEDKDIMMQWPDDSDRYFVSRLEDSDMGDSGGINEEDKDSNEEDKDDDMDMRSEASDNSGHGVDE